MPALNTLDFPFRIADRSAAGSDDGLAERILASVAAAQPVPGRGAQHPHAADEPPGQGLLRRVCAKGKLQEEGWKI